MGADAVRGEDHQVSRRRTPLQLVAAAIRRTALLVFIALFAHLAKFASPCTSTGKLYYDMPVAVRSLSPFRASSHRATLAFVPVGRSGSSQASSIQLPRAESSGTERPEHLSSLGNDGTSAPSVDKMPARRSLLTLAAVMFVVGATLAAAETAITTLWPWKVRELAEKEGESSPFTVLESDLTRFLTTILVTTTSATVLSTAIATEVAGDIFGPAAVGYVTATMTVFFLFFGEILPKALAVHAPAKVARVMVPVISSLSVIVYPVGKLLAWISTQILRILKLPMESDATVSEEELRLIVAGADRSGSIEKYESQIIQNVLDLEETDVREVMCPRVDVVALPDNSTLAELLELESDAHYSRMPVYEGSIDNIVGVAMSKSLLRYLREDATLLSSTKVSEIMDPAFFVPESMSVWIVLEEMRKRRLHMAVVVDEYGGTAGLVTLEDILEEVVGEIYDEDDDYEAESQFIEQDDDGNFLVEGQADLEKVDSALRLNMSEDDLHDYGTISGFLCARMGGIPEVGDQLVYNRVRFSVVDANDRRIIGLRAEILTAEELLRLAEDLEDSDIPSGDPRLLEAGTANGFEIGDRSSGSHEGTNSGNSRSVGNGHTEDFGIGKLFSGIVGSDSPDSVEPGASGRTSENVPKDSNAAPETDQKRSKF